MSINKKKNIKITKENIEKDWTSGDLIIKIFVLIEHRNATVQHQPTTAIPWVTSNSHPLGTTSEQNTETVEAVRMVYISGRASGRAPQGLHPGPGQALCC